MKVTRSYKLPVIANRDKQETAEYLLDRFSIYVQYCAGRLFFNGNKNFSTAGYGFLFNQAQHKAKSVIKALRAAEKETGNKVNVPLIKSISAPCILEKSKNSSFDYFVSVSNQWTKMGKTETTCKINKSFK